MDTSAHSLAQAKESQQDHTTFFEQFPKDGYGGSAGGKRLNAAQNECASFVQDRNGGSASIFTKQQAGSLPEKKFDSEQANLSVEPHVVDKQAREPIPASVHLPSRSIGVEKGAQIMCSSSSSLVLSKEDLIKQELRSHSVDLVSAELNGSFGLDDHFDARTDKEHFHPDDRSKIGINLTSEAAVERDLQQLENSIKFFDLYKTNTSVLHPLGSIGSRHSSSDLKVLEHIDLVEVNSKKQSHVRSLSFGMTRKDQKFTLAPHKKLKSTVRSWLDYEESKRVHPWLQGTADELQSEAPKKRSNVAHCENQGEKAKPSDSFSEPEEATLAQPCDTEQGCGQPVVNEDLLGEMQQNRTWKISGSDRISKDPASSESNDLGPDELFRYLEFSDVDEKYVDTGNPILNFESKARSAHVRNLSDMGISSRTLSDDTLSSSISGSHIHSSHVFLSAKDIPFVVDSVEVVGARQRRGGSSLWDRMVGVHDHTVYIIKVVSGKHEWEVLRRYRDFKNFYQQLKRIFNGQRSSPLLSPLEDVGSESRQLFGNISPNVVQARSVRIQKFFQSLLQAGPPFCTASPVFWFLRPPQGAFEYTGFEEHLMVRTCNSQKSLDVQLGNLDSPQLQFSLQSEGTKREHLDVRCPITTGKTIKLVSVIHQTKSLKQVLNDQHYSCAGCYKHLDYENGLIQGFAQAFGRGRPRYCDYTGQLFCSSCHLNEFSVLPACVLWHWDFTPRRVSQLAKGYLDSIYDQPLLCVKTINPYLYQRVHCLRSVKETRTKLSKVVSCMRCPTHARLLQIMGSRRYLLENNNFFALRDLEDLSKGAFAVLPGLLTAVMKTLVLHVTKQCAVCQDSGEWCGADILCEDPFLPIFPFNEEDGVVNCKTCNAPFHQRCFAKCRSCPSCPQEWVDKKQRTAS